MVLKMKNFKRFIVIILAICAVMVCASCKKCSKDKNRLIPTLSDPTGTYLKNYKKRCLLSITKFLWN